MSRIAQQTPVSSQAADTAAAAGRDERIDNPILLEWRGPYGGTPP